VRRYLLGLRERGAALGTFKSYHGGIQFLYRRTLDRDWALFQKKEFARPNNSVFPRSFGRASARAVGRREESRSQGLLRPHVRLRPAHK
jgi:hypothetical protein